MLADEQHPHAQAVLEALLVHPEYFAVPELFAFETFSVLQRLHPRPVEAFVEGMLPLLQSGLLRYPMTEEIAQLGSKFVSYGHSGYDACYAALAKELGATWLTFDERAHGKLSELEVSINLAKDLPENMER